MGARANGQGSTLTKSINEGPSMPNKKKRPGRRRHSVIQEQEVNGETVVSLTSEGQSFWSAVLASMSHEAGQAITGDDVGIILKKLREETGQADPQFNEPPVMECFLRLVRTYGEWAKHESPRDRQRM
jgi:hypothetical protein